MNPMRKKLTLLKKLDLVRPSTEEMLKEISQSGLTIKLENGNVDYLANHKDEVIKTMWKVVKMSQMVEPGDLPQLLDEMLLENSSPSN